MAKIAVILLNLGGPDKTENIYPFLRNFFLDPAIIRLPYLFRNLLSYYIAKRRSKGEALESYTHLGGKSPLLENTQAQATALENHFKEKGQEQIKCFVCMRYWHPLSEDVVKNVKIYNPDKIVLLPLYPQYSTSTTDSSFKDWYDSAKKADFQKPTFEIREYPTEKGFIEAGVDRIRPLYEQASSYGRPKMLFSAHSLPKSFIRSGDPYQKQCEQTVAAIVKALDIPDLDWLLAYQSQLNERTWIGPSLSQEIQKAEQEKRPIVIYPVAFVSEHVETLVELDIEYREIAENSPYYGRAHTVGCHERFIAGLADLIEQQGEK